MRVRVCTATHETSPMQRRVLTHPYRNQTFRICFPQICICGVAHSGTACNCSTASPATQCDPFCRWRITGKCSARHVTCPHRPRRGAHPAPARHQLQEAPSICVPQYYFRPIGITPPPPHTSELLRSIRERYGPEHPWQKKTQPRIYPIWFQKADRWGCYMEMQTPKCDSEPIPI